MIRRGARPYQAWGESGSVSALIRSFLWPTAIQDRERTALFLLPAVARGPASLPDLAPWGRPTTGPIHGDWKRRPSARVVFVVHADEDRPQRIRRREWGRMRGSVGAVLQLLGVDAIRRPGRQGAMNR